MKPTVQTYQRNSTDVQLRAHLLLRGLSLAELARRMGISDTYLIYILNGKRKATHQRKRLIEEFEIPAEFMKEAA